MEGAWKYSPAAAVPVRTKIPEPIMAPMPSAVSDHGPNVFFSFRSGSSASEISLSMDLQQKSWFSEVRTTSLDGGSVVVGCDKESDSPEAEAITQRVPHFSPVLGEVGFRTDESCFYRFAWPRANFLTFGFFDPRG